MIIKDDGTKVYENLTPDEITQLEAQAGLKATEMIDDILSEIVTLTGRVKSLETAVEDINSPGE